MLMQAAPPEFSHGGLFSSYIDCYYVLSVSSVLLLSALFCLILIYTAIAGTGMCTAAAATATALSRLLIPDHHADYQRNRYDKDKRCYYGSHIIDKECHMFHLLFSC